MVNKKRVKKSSKRNFSKKIKSNKRTNNPGDKTKLVFNNLLFFAAFSLISLIVLQWVSNPILVNLFLILSITLGFTAVAFLIALLVFIIKKVIKR